MNGVSAKATCHTSRQPANPIPNRTMSLRIRNLLERRKGPSTESLREAKRNRSRERDGELKDVMARMAKYKEEHNALAFEFDIVLRGSEQTPFEDAHDEDEE